MADQQPPDTNSDNAQANSAVHTTPGGRRHVILPPLPPPITPLVKSVSARVLADAEKKLSTLQSEVDALKAREHERGYGLARRDAAHLVRPASTPGPSMFTSYPNFEESEDYGDLISEADRKRMKQELDTHYRLRREQMFKQMQLGFRQKQVELERTATQPQKKKKNKKKSRKKQKDSYGLRRWGGTYDDESDSSSAGESSDEDESDASEDEWRNGRPSPWNRAADSEELKRARAKVDVVVCTTEYVPGFRLVEKLGTFKVVVPRSLLSYDNSPEEVENAFQMAKMVRQEVMDKAVGQARRRRANAIVDFRYKTELSQNINDDNVVLITATGKCCIIRRLLSEREQYLRHQMEVSRKRYRRDKDVSILRQVLEKTQHDAERKAHVRALSQMDERDLRTFLDELQGKRSAQQAEARKKADPHRDALEKLLGQKVRFDSDLYASKGRPGPSGPTKEQASEMIQEMLANVLTGQAAQVLEKAAGVSSPKPGRDWQTKVTDDDGDAKEGEIWEAYDWN